MRDNKQPTFALILATGLMFSNCYTAQAQATSATRTTKVACVGDSITFGAYIANRETNCWPAQLGKMLGDKYEVKNFGVSGTTAQKSSPGSYGNTEAYRLVLQYLPDIIIIKLGTNDANQNGTWKGKDAFIKDYKEIVNAFLQIKSRPKIFLCYPTPSYPGEIGKRDLVLESEVLPAIDSIGQDMQLKVIDLFHPLNDKPELFPDKVHPNAAGARIIAAEIYSTLTNNYLRKERP